MKVITAALGLLLASLAFAEVEEIEGSDLDGSYVEGISIEILEKTAEFDNNDEDIKEFKELVITSKTENAAEEAILLQTQITEQIITMESQAARDQIDTISRSHELPSNYNPNDAIIQDNSKTYITFEGLIIPEVNDLEFRTDLINLLNTPDGTQLQINTPVVQ